MENWQAETFWRVMFLIGLLPAFIQMILIFFGYIPESPSSLIKKNRKEEAK